MRAHLFLLEFVFSRKLSLQVDDDGRRGYIISWRDGKKLSFGNGEHIFRENQEKIYIVLGSGGEG